MTTATAIGYRAPIIAKSRPSASALAEAFIPYVTAVGRGEKLKRDLTFDEASDAMGMILRREATDVQVGAFLAAQRIKGESVDEIRGFVHAIRTEAIRSIRPNVSDLLDLAVPYDGKAKTAQLAPAVAMILAAAGVPVVLHGGEDVPTKAGATPGAVLRALGVATDLSPSAVQQQIETFGLGYLSLAQYAPRLQDILPVRRQIGLRTLFNTVEKLLNPADAPYQVSGFFHANYIKRIRTTQTGTKASWIIQGEEGSIEAAAGRRTPIYSPDPAADRTVDPTRVGLTEREKITLSPNVNEHALVNIAVLAADPGPATKQAALTAGAILTLLGAARDLADGYAQARQILSRGLAREQLYRIRSFK